MPNPEYQRLLRCGADELGRRLLGGSAPIATLIAGLDDATLAQAVRNTWHTFTPEWAQAYGMSQDYLTRVASERRSKVTFDIEPAGEMVKLTVVHDGFEPGSTVLEGITQGWPVILASLKTLLETGDALPAQKGA